MVFLCVPGGRVCYIPVTSGDSLPDVSVLQDIEISSYTDSRMTLHGHGERLCRVHESAAPSGLLPDRRDAIGSAVVCVRVRVRHPSRAHQARARPMNITIFPGCFKDR